ncbi:MAG: helix-turn-helix transcriptional regulator [Deltaproteobacteria bacterium]|nr:MAG: helix-turn-helix transcriptional regulator [Deltaproteobacteria bacterium]
MAVPTPGRPVRGSRTGRPIMALLDLLGRRWALRILWEVRHGPLTFRALRERCDGMSPSVLMQRLGELREAGIIELGTDGYAATAEGRSLLHALAPLKDWAERWVLRSARYRRGASRCSGDVRNKS